MTTTATPAPVSRYSGPPLRLLKSDDFPNFMDSARFDIMEHPELTFPEFVLKETGFGPQFCHPVDYVCLNFLYGQHSHQAWGFSAADIAEVRAAA